MARKKATEVTEAEAIETKTEDIKAEETVAESKTAEEKAAKPKKAPAKRKSTKTVKEDETESTKEEAVKEELPQKSSSKATGCKTAKESVQTTLCIQYDGKQIATEDLIKSAKDIWKYDLKRKVSELTSIELYVKTEEDMVYYVMNGDVKGSFSI